MIKKIVNSNMHYSNSLYLEDKPYPINHNNTFYPKNNIFVGKNNNKTQFNKKNYNFQNNDIKIINNYLTSNKIKNKNIKQELKYKESLFSNINHNYNNNYQEIKLLLIKIKIIIV